MKKFLLIAIVLILFSHPTKENVIQPTDSFDLNDTSTITQIEVPTPNTPEINEIEEEQPIIYPSIKSLGTNKLQIYNSEYTIPEKLSNNFYSIIDKYSMLNIGVYAISLKDYTCIGYNESYAIDTASSVKGPFCLYVMKEIANGNHSLNETMVYTEKYYLGGSGEVQYSSFGTTYTIQELVTKCINCSDNIAYLMLQDYFGYQGYNQMITSLGCTTWLNGYTKWGKFTSEELAIIWNEIYEFSKTSEEGQFLLDLLINAKYNFIKDNMQRYSKIAHKSGFNPKAYNDAAIIFSESDLTTDLNKANDYILVIMTSPGNSGYNSTCLKELCKEMDLIMRELALQQ